MPRGYTEEAGGGRSCKTTGGGTGMKTMRVCIDVDDMDKAVAF
jgi:hypothetical protein